MTLNAECSLLSVIYAANKPIMQSVIMLNVVTLSVVMLSGVAPRQ
jgi:hypothetical protein